MNATNLASRLGVTAAMAWIVVWSILFVGLGINHALTRHSDGGKPFLAGAVLAAFVVSVWLAASESRPGAAFIANLVLAGAVLVIAAFLGRDPAPFAVRWSTNQRSSVMFVASWVWPVVVWLSIVSAAAVAEVHHVLHSRAR